MKPSYRIADRIDYYLMIVVRYAAIIILLFNVYILFDTFYISKNAFASYDLLQYKPVSANAESELNGFADIIRINSDVVGWLTVYDTNIDYPVLQGRDNFEYANKDVFGNSSLTGSLYLDSQNPGFTDFSSIIYGHHMENGAMFGDIDNFVSDSYLESHHDGYLQTPEGNYRLTIFACISTDAYENTIYNYVDSAENRKTLCDYIRNNKVSTYGDYLDSNLENVNKLIILSTCESGDTYGRRVLIADAVPGAGRIEEEAAPTMLTAIGHLSDSEHWALLNLICALTVLLLGIDVIRHKLVTGALIEVGLLLTSVFIFLFTENITKRIVLCDKYTLLMLVVLVVAFTLDLLLLKKKENEDE